MAYAKKTLKTTLTVTWKVHCVTAHLSKFLSMHGKGMADVCEQVGESADMNTELQRHKRSESHPNPGDYLLTAIVKFASWNVFNISGTKKDGRQKKTKNSG